VSKLFSCDLCPTTFDSKNEFQNHMKLHETADEFVCDICGFETLHKGNMRRHKWNHSNEKRFKCDKCDYATNYNQILKRHMSNHLPPDDNFVCLKCPAKFESKISLQEHLTSAHGLRFKCDEVNCDFMTKKMGYLKRHKRSHAKSYQSSLDQSLATETQSTFPISDQFDYEQPSIDEAALGNQLEVLVEAKIFQCDICEERFSFKIQMKTHRLIEHENPKAFSCQICEKKFESKSSLQSHLKTHEEEVRCSLHDESQSGI